MALAWGACEEYTLKDIARYQLPLYPERQAGHLGNKIAEGFTSALNVKWCRLSDD
jgi:hypothetical protein